MVLTRIAYCGTNGLSLIKQSTLILIITKRLSFQKNLSISVFIVVLILMEIKPHVLLAEESLSSLFQILGGASGTMPSGAP